MRKAAVLRKTCGWFIFSRCRKHSGWQLVAVHRRMAELPGSRPVYATVRHDIHEWAWDDDGDGRQEVYCNTCEGVGAALRTHLHPFRGVHKQYLRLYVATYEIMGNVRRITPHLIRRMCLGDPSGHTDYT